jgi:tRNA threonylcarbamoyladenosine biosynthesis protein TsaE
MGALPVNRVDCRRLEGPQATEALGYELGRRLRGGDVVALCGPLGAGKTQLVKGLARGLGVPPEEVVISPTFVLVREYRGRLLLRHVDAYRLSGAAELAALGWDEFRAEPDSLIALEWADRVAELVGGDAIRIELAYTPEPTVRELRLIWPDERTLPPA